MRLFPSTTARGARSVPVVVFAAAVLVALSLAASPAVAAPLGDANGIVTDTPAPVPADPTSGSGSPVPVPTATDSPAATTPPLVTPPEPTVAPAPTASPDNPSPAPVVTPDPAPAPAPAPAPQPQPQQQPITPSSDSSSWSNRGTQASPSSSSSSGASQPAANNNNNAATTPPSIKLLEQSQTGNKAVAQPPAADAVATPDAATTDDKKDAPKDEPAPSPTSDAASASPSESPAAASPNPNNNNNGGDITSATATANKDSSSTSSSPLVAIISTVGVVGLVAGVAAFGYARKRRRSRETVLADVPVYVAPAAAGACNGPTGIVNIVPLSSPAAAYTVPEAAKSTAGVYRAPWYAAGTAGAQIPDVPAPVVPKSLQRSASKGYRMSMQQAAHAAPPQLAPLDFNSYGSTPPAAESSSLPVASRVPEIVHLDSSKDRRMIESVMTDVSLPMPSQAPEIVHLDSSKDRRMIQSVYARDSRYVGPEDEDEEEEEGDGLESFPSTPAGATVPAWHDVQPTAKRADDDAALSLAAALAELDPHGSVGAASDSPSSTLSFHNGGASSAASPKAVAVAAPAATGSTVTEGGARRVAIPYGPELDDELELRVGDLVVVEHVYLDNWAVGHNLTSGESGAFPVICLQ
ncbi:hypothetical protein AMAG_13211 [Allomyces macrogynus ATCC 38327]|uniref:SH3 domain-containing protein n=1 Tax=Allomyces macrogynus (strain ATCC 38327) TaxID=578462 RepID=A0A0L0T066_ALLM3|nr:hypothetical protein AMAG_13211 [Allomyces macrogynus ATCC 38327]|eukprot:KNE68040.1 hypothetical protein AMAG_13211 [Allomyces macrogynus ATCC 38327]